MTHIWSVPGIEFQSFDEITETRPVILVTTPGSWGAVKTDLQSLQIAHSYTIQSATASKWMEMSAEVLANKSNLEDPVIYAVGGGLPVDAAKYLSHHTSLPLYSLPTALSVDAFFTWASAVRHDGCVTYLETRPPDKVVIDFDVLSTAPETIRAAGICDVLSIATALWDWEYAEEMGENTEGLELIPWAADAAQAVLQGALECAEAAGAGDAGGLKQLLDCLALEAQLCNLIGHSRPQEGSEHYFAYAVENYLEKRPPQAHLVGPGIMLMAERQEQEVEELRYALTACHIPLNQIPSDIITKTLKGLPEYVLKHNQPFGIAHQYFQD
jgi:glycerol-1-phosphate dehydrogenase [NAD(P)+]